MTPSILKSETARVNGAQSIGPVTAEGKAVSAMNSLKHGLCSKQVVLPGEDQAAFDRLQADYIRIHRPQGAAETELVETLAAASWRLKRMIRLEAAVLTDDNADPIKALSLLLRYENQLNRTYDQSLKRFKELQENQVEQASACRVPSGRGLSPAGLRNEPKPTAKTSQAEPPQVAQELKTLPPPPPPIFHPALKHPVSAL